MGKQPSATGNLGIKVTRGPVPKKEKEEKEDKDGTASSST